jgi:hypothetical protein
LLRKDANADQRQRLVNELKTLAARNTDMAAGWVALSRVYWRHLFAQRDGSWQTKWKPWFKQRERILRDLDDLVRRQADFMCACYQ